MRSTSPGPSGYSTLGPCSAGGTRSRTAGGAGGGSGGREGQPATPMTTTNQQSNGVTRVFTGPARVSAGQPRPLADVLIPPKPYIIVKLGTPPISHSKVLPRLNAGDSTYAGPS